MLNELITNALKYAFDIGDVGLIKVCLQEKEDGLYIEVTDNGKGFELNQEGFGMKLINSFTRKLEGELNIHSDDGTQVALMVKNYQRA